MARHSRTAVASSWGGVVSRRITSTSGIRWAGLKKCKPISRSGWLRPAAKSSREMVEVLEAKIVSGAQAASSRCSTARLTLRSSKTDSTTNPACAASCQWLEADSRASIRSARSRGNRPSAARFSTALRIRCNPFCTVASSWSSSVTRTPAANNAWAIPDPMVPTPATAAESIAAPAASPNSGSLLVCRVAKNSRILFRAPSDSMHSAKAVCSRRSPAENESSRPVRTQSRIFPGATISGRTWAASFAATSYAACRATGSATLSVRSPVLRSAADFSIRPADSSSCPPGTTASTSPDCSEWAASTTAPVSSIRSAGSGPTTLGSRCVPPAAGLMPNVTSGIPSRVPAAATR